MIDLNKIVCIICSIVAIIILAFGINYAITHQPPAPWGSPGNWPSHETGIVKLNGLNYTYETVEVYSCSLTGCTGPIVTKTYQNVSFAYAYNGGDGESSVQGSGTELNNHTNSFDLQYDNGVPWFSDDQKFGLAWDGGTRLLLLVEV